MDCNTCGSRKAEPVPFQAHESDMARMERSNKRLWVVIIMLIAAILACIVLVVYFNGKRIDALEELRELERSIETVYEYEVEQEADGSGRNYVVSGDFHG